MIKEYIFGTVIIKTQGFDESNLCEKIRNERKAISLYIDSGSVFIKTYAINAKYVIKECENRGFLTEIQDCKGFPFTLNKNIRRYGVYLGVIISILFSVYFALKMQEYSYIMNSITYRGVKLNEYTKTGISASAVCT